MKKSRNVFLAILLSGAFAAAAAETEKAPDAAELRELSVKLLDKLSASLVDVEYFFRPDENGKRPEFTVQYYCPGCRSMHSGSADSLIEDQRPFKVPGYAVAPDEFISSDIGALPEWIESLDLVFGGKRYPAKVVAYYPAQKSVLLKTASPVPGVVPLAFNPKAEGKRFGFSRSEESGVEHAFTAPWAPATVVRNLGNGETYVKTAANVLVVNEKGEVAALSMNDRLDVGTAPAEAVPSAWKQVSAAEHGRKLAEFKAMLEKNLYPVRIRLKPQKPLTGFAAHYQRRSENRNEADGIAIRMKDGKVLIAASLSPAETARLSRTVLTVDGKEIPARFVGSLQFFGALVAEPEQPLPGGGIAFYRGDAGKLSGASVYDAQLKSFGDKLELRVFPQKLESFDVGFRGMIVPAGRLLRQGYVFTENGELVSLPLERRKLDRDYASTEAVAASMVLALAGNFDPANVPRRERKRSPGSALNSSSSAPSSPGRTKPPNSPKTARTDCSSLTSIRILLPRGSASRPVISCCRSRRTAAPPRSNSKAISSARKWINSRGTATIRFRPSTMTRFRLRGALPGTPSTGCSAASASAAKQSWRSYRTAGSMSIRSR